MAGVGVREEAHSTPRRSGATKPRSGQGRMIIGTSGWHYQSWWGPFFPEGTTKKDALRYYASQFSAVELNAPFYRTPALSAVASWAEQTPPGFLFAWKASKFITHWKRLRETSANSLDLIWERLAVLGDKAGPVLFQLPPRMEADRERLATFIAMLPRGRRFAFEFRHPSWYAPAILSLLSDHDCSLCISDHADAPAPWEATASFVYVRGHGPSGRYWGRYEESTLSEWARQAKRWRRAGRDVLCFFDNDIKSAAPADARVLSGLVGASGAA